MNKKRLFRIFGFICVLFVALMFLYLRGVKRGPLSPYLRSSIPLQKPNIIILSIDTLRADHLSCYGYPRKTSFYIDAFTKDAVSFRNAISQSPLTTPAHMSIFTSLTPPVHQVVNNDQVNDLGADTLENKNLHSLGHKIETLPLIMKSNGYLTVGLHGGGNVSAEFGFGRGFEIYKRWGDMLKADDRMGDVKEAIKESKESNSPLFIFLHHYVCHDPYLNSPKEFRAHFMPTVTSGLSVDIDEVAREADFRIRREKFWQKVDLSIPQQKDYAVSLYDAAVYYSDYIFGKLIETLKKENLYENSIVILVSDHGEEFHEHLDKLHWRLFVETLSVPLIIKFPRSVYAGSIINAAVRTMDIMPFLFDFLGIKSRNFMQGVSFLPLVTRKGSYNPCIASYSLSEPMEGWGVRLVKDGFVYSNQESHGVSRRLFNINNDRLETRNLIDSNPGIAGQMDFLAGIVLKKDKIIREKIGLNNAAPVQKNERLEKELKSLGYAQ